MLLLARIALGLALAYVGLVLFAWRFQDRIAFPAPQTPLPDPRVLGWPAGQRVALATRLGTSLVGWYLPPRDPPEGAPPDELPREGQPALPSPALLWFYGNVRSTSLLRPILVGSRPRRRINLTMNRVQR
jgi:hypothetical protein